MEFEAEEDEATKRQLAGTSPMEASSSSPQITAVKGDSSKAGALTKREALTAEPTCHLNNSLCPAPHL